jgi:hypothetical protein
MTSLRPNKAGLVLGAILAIWHSLWALLVAFGWAQTVIDFVFWMHFLKPVYVVGPFSVGTAFVLIGITASIGYVTGFVFGVIWNRLRR